MSANEYTDSKVDIVIFGADGQQGIIASKFLLLRGYKILCIDRYTINIQKELSTFNPIVKRGDISNFDFVDRNIKEHAPKIIINLSPYHDDRITELCLTNKINYIDISSTSFVGKRLSFLFNNYNNLEFLNLKKHNNNFSIVTGCGCAPGISGILLKKIEHEFDTIENIESGFSWTSNTNKFVPPFSLYDAAYELHKDCAILKNGIKQKIEPKSISKKYNFPNIGIQEVFAIDHAELDSFYNFCRNKNVKNISFFAGFPDVCLEVLNALNNLQLLNNSKKIYIQSDEKSVQISCLELLEAISKTIDLPDNYQEREVIWTTIEGIRENKNFKKTAICEVPPIKGWEKYGSNVDTGITAALTSIFILSNKIKPGFNYFEEAIPLDEFITELIDFGFKFDFSYSLDEIS